MRLEQWIWPKKELLEIVFALDKFCAYLLGSKIVIFSYHVALRFLLKKPDTRPRLIWWMLLLQEFDIEIKDKKGAKNSIINHLSRIERESDRMPIRDEFPNEQLLQLNKITPWFADICNFIVASQFPLEASHCTKRNLRVMPNTTYGMIHIFGDSTIIKSFIGAFRISRSN
ncbi:Retrovirus-related Pol polyprotein from transposon 17.6, partial [Mucuna pruriens]